MKFIRPRGTSDILPDEQNYWNYVLDKAKNTAIKFGFQSIETPTFEDTNLFKRGVGEGTDVVMKEMYSFDDLGGDSITLRPEGTASVCRAYIENGMKNQPQPQKYFYNASMFRYERPQAGRLREHHQFGCEIIGDDSTTHGIVIARAVLHCTMIEVTNDDLRAMAVRVALQSTMIQPVLHRQQL